ncbi:LOW QUALITY PROTEIN: triggering receptor expressed on myeloid cells 1 [Neophocaena asiaeorientalis asiaeorientalis]|uniref:LOW QUALITY PROTEIN: triggering receptor expressed on myeloid cells 1 n=1 Tax=Neophocaena asiaeorientalis asiaeorientalis TaxID=1706337 RepID=A0A341D468_NEOAA|nr:LOW QUALITY PROTEIN: triggering receptor expressed on myeloid cells 1 [Neophocaena asiaeorientalis asiaeorientalis]
MGEGERGLALPSFFELQAQRAESGAGHSAEGPQPEAPLWTLERFALRWHSGYPPLQEREESKKEDGLDGTHKIFLPERASPPLRTASTVVPHRLRVANRGTAAGVGYGCRLQPPAHPAEQPSRVFSPSLPGQTKAPSQKPKREKLFLTEPSSNSLLTEIQTASELPEEKCTLAEERTLKVDCPITHDTDSNSRKAWQSLKDKGAVQTPAITERVSGEFSQVQVGRYFLKDVPSESMLRVQMTNLPVEDTGLYRCVIYQPPKDPIILFYLVHLVDQERQLMKCLAHTTSVSSPGLKVTPTNVTDVTRAPGTRIVIPVARGLLSKNLVFIALFAVTQRSFAS